MPDTNDPVLEETLVIGDLKIDLLRIRVWRAGKERQLSLSEFFLLNALARSPDKEFSRAELLKIARRWSEQRNERIVDQMIANVRRKTRIEGRPDTIITVLNIEYKLNTMCNSATRYTKRKLPESEARRVVELTRDGQSVREIANALELNRSKVNRIQAQLRLEGKL